MAITVFINEPGIGLTDQSDRIWYGATCSFSLIRGQRGTASIPFIINIGDSYSPTVGSPLYIHEIVNNVDTIVFAGRILTVEEKWNGNDGCHNLTISCVSLESCFDVLRITPPRAYTGMTAGEIITALFADLCAGVPVTLGTIDLSAGGILPDQVYRNERLSDVFGNLATLAGSNTIWGVQMSDQTLYLQPNDTTPAPFTLASWLWETGDWKIDETDYRNRQLVQISFTAFSTSNEMFEGDGEANIFLLRGPVDRIISAMLTTSVQATAQGIFGSISPASPAQPDPGDTFTITGQPDVTEDPYTFVVALDNTLRNQILIGATVDDTCQNTVDAINAKASQAGIAFSLPTWENDVCNADDPVDNSFILRVKNPGTGGNAVALAASSASFGWSDVICSGGEDGINNSLQFGLFSAGLLSADLTYQPGSNYVDTAYAVPAGLSLSVAYYRLGADTIIVEDSAAVAIRAAIEHGSGKYQQLITDTQNADARAGYIEALQALVAFKTIPASFQFTIDQALLSPGQLLTISVQAPVGAPALVDGLWLVQEIQAAIVPGMETLFEPYGHFRYTVTVINTNQIATFVDFWENLAIVSPAGSQTVNDVATQTATPKLLPPSTTGDPTTGSPTNTAGQQWAQETPSLHIGVSGTDLTVSDDDDKVVTSATYTFVEDDVGKELSIGDTEGWNTGNYIIDSVTDGAATLLVSPAAVGTTDGHWSLIDTSVYELIWAPTKSAWTQNQIAVVAKISGGVTSVLTPFRYSEHGYVIDPIDPTLGPDYTIDDNLITFKDPPADDDIILVTYFPAGPRATPVVGPHGSDLVSDGGFGDFGRKFSSASYTFVDGDIGKNLIITGGAGWTAESDVIAAIVGAQAAVTTSDNGSGLTGGIWHLSS